MDDLKCLSQGHRPPNISTSLPPPLPPPTYIIQDNRVYMLCKYLVLEGVGLHTVLFASPYSQEGKYVHTLYFIDLCYY